MKTIMLCLNKLDIGGVETAALNQTIQLIKKNYRVIILADDGIYREKFEKEGAIFIEIKYSSKDKDIYNKVSYVMDIMDKYNVEQVHIHQLICINIIFFACILKQIPYIAYLHNSIPGTYQHYENNIKSYKELLKLFFNYAERIIAIQEKSKLYNIEKYNLPNEKYKIIRNSIDFDKFKVKDNKIPQNIKKFLIISRLQEEKKPSIYNAIELFKAYHKKYNDSTLTIVGDGQIKKDVEMQISDIKASVNMLGKRNDIPQIISEHHIIVGLDRCILEAITMKRLAIISGYEKMKEVITSQNIDEASKNNFNGDNLKDTTIEQLIETIESLNLEDIRKIVEENYKFAFENLNIENNVYVIENPENISINIKNTELIETIMRLMELFSETIDYTDNVYEECKKSQKWFEGQLIAKENEIEKLKDENEQVKKIYSSKFYKLYSKIKKILNKLNPLKSN